METNEFITSLKNKYNYSNEMINLLEKAIPALIAYYGEDKKNIIYGTLNECEIHIQKENENAEEYLNQYFGTNKKWDIPFMAGALQDNELYLKDNRVYSKSIIYIMTKRLNKYTPFDFNNADKVASIIHELCHAIKSYGRIRVENGQVITQSGLITSTHNYDPNTNSFEEIMSSNIGLEETLNTYDEEKIMSIITGLPYKTTSSYKSMVEIIKKLMEHKELVPIIKKCQFTGDNEWKEFLGKENADVLINNLEEWVKILYISPRELMKNRAKIMEQLATIDNNLITFVENYSTPTEIAEFKQARTLADKKTIELIQQTIIYNNQTNKFEKIEQSSRKQL